MIFIVDLPLDVVVGRSRRSNVLKSGQSAPQGGLYPSGITLPKWSKLKTCVRAGLQSPRLLQVEDLPVSSVRNRHSCLAHLPCMNDVQKTTIRRILPTQCIRCGAELPPPRAPGDRVSFADLAAAKQRTTIDGHVSRGHFRSELLIVSSWRRSRSSGPSMKAATSPNASGGFADHPGRAVTNLLTALSGLVRSGTVLVDGKWAPAVRSIVDLDRAIRNAADREGRHRRR